MAGSVVSAAGTFGLAIVVSRGYGARQAGLFFSVTAVLTLLVAASQLGVDSGLARFLLRLEARQHPGELRRLLRLAAGPVVGVSLVLAVLVLVLASPIGDALGLGTQGALLLRLAVLGLPAAVIAELCFSVTRAFGAMRTTVVVDRLVRSLVQPLLALVVVITGGGLTWLIVGWTSAYVLSAALALLTAVSFLRTRKRVAPVAESPVALAPDPGLRRRFWVFTWPRGVAGLAQVGVQKADIVMVAALLGPAAAAAYTVATRFVAVGQMANQAIHQVLQARFTSILLEIEPERSVALRTVFRVTTSWGILLVWPVYLVVGCAPGAYLSVFGSRYANGVHDSHVVVMVMAAAMLVAVASGPVDTLLLMAGHSALSMTNAVSALVVDVVLCLVLVPRIGIAGAALAWAVAVTVRSALAFWQVRRQLGVTPVVGHQFRVAALPVLCFVAPLGAAGLLGRSGLVSWLGVSLAAGLCYLLALWRLRHPLHLDLLGRSLRRRSPRVQGPTPRPRHRINDPSKESEHRWRPAGSHVH